MVRFQPVKVSPRSLRALRLLGLYPHPDRTTWNYWGRYIWFVLTASIIVPMVIFIIKLNLLTCECMKLTRLQGVQFFVNRHNINKAANISIIFAGMISAVLKGFFFVRRRIRLHDLLNNIQCILDTRNKKPNIFACAAPIKEHIYVFVFWKYRRDTGRRATVYHSK